MTVELKPMLEKRLAEAAKQQSVTVPDLVERVLTNFLDSLGDGLDGWAQASQKAAAKSWPAEDFSDWSPPRGH
jgi:hypothetical protein